MPRARRRKTSELFKIVLKVHKEIKINGICFAISTACGSKLITYVEELRLENTLEKRMPTKKKHSDFFKHKDYVYGHAYWWPRITRKEIETFPNWKVTHYTTQRVKFIRELIKFYKAKND